MSSLEKLNKYKEEKQNLPMCSFCGHPPIIQNMGGVIIQDSLSSGEKVEKEANYLVCSNYLCKMRTPLGTIEEVIDYWKKIHGGGEKEKKLPPHPIQPLYLDHHNTLRFKGNSIIRVLLATSPLDLNTLDGMGFPPEDQEQLSQLLGCSLSHFGELHYVSDDTYQRAEEQWKKQQEEEDE